MMDNLVIFLTSSHISLEDSKVSNFVPIRIGVLLTKITVYTKSPNISKFYYEEDLIRYWFIFSIVNPKNPLKSFSSVESMIDLIIPHPISLNLLLICLIYWIRTYFPFLISNLHFDLTKFFKNSTKSNSGVKGTLKIAVIPFSFKVLFIRRFLW